MGGVEVRARLEPEPSRNEGNRISNQVRLAGASLYMSRSKNMNCQVLITTFVSDFFCTP